MVIVVSDTFVLSWNFEVRIRSPIVTKLVGIVLPSIELAQTRIEAVGQGGGIPLAVVEGVILIVVSIIGIKFSSLIISKSGLIAQVVGVKNASLIKSTVSHCIPIFTHNLIKR